MINIIFGKRGRKYAEFSSPLLPARYIAQQNPEGLWYVYALEGDDVLTLDCFQSEAEAVRYTLEIATQALVDAGALERAS